MRTDSTMGYSVTRQWRPWLRSTPIQDIEFDDPGGAVFNDVLRQAFNPDKPEAIIGRWRIVRATAPNYKKRTKLGVIEIAPPRKTTTFDVLKLVNGGTKDDIVNALILTDANRSECVVNWRKVGNAVDFRYGEGAFARLVAKAYMQAHGQAGAEPTRSVN